MFDGLLKSGFHTKCKSLIKMIIKRIDVIMRKRNATVKFLKKDIADLLAGGLDTNPFERAEGLLLELDVSYCYNFVQTCCEFVKQRLLVMDKQRECPAECRESVSSLISAAAGFSDLPELRDLRQIFQERYGNSLDYYANKEFVEKLASKSYTVERKIQLLKDIALEFLISWDSRAFERRMSMPSAMGQPKTYGKVECADNNYKLGVNGINSDVKGDLRNGRVRGRSDMRAYKHEFFGGTGRNFPKRNEINLEPRQKIIGDDHKALNGQKEGSLKKDRAGAQFQGMNDGNVDKQQVSNGNGNIAVKSVRSGYSSRGKLKDSSDVGFKPCYKWENGVPANDIQDDPDIAPGYSKLKSRSDHNEIASYSNNFDGQSTILNSMPKKKEEEINYLKPCHNSPLPPPYVKPNIKVKDPRYGGNMRSVPVGFDCNGVLKGISSSDSSATNNWLGEGQQENHERQFVKYSMEDDCGHKKDHRHQDELRNAPRPKPISHRRHSKSQSTHKGTDTSEDEVTRKPQSRRRNHSRHGLQQLNGDHNEIDVEESKLDRLLIHYSKKPSRYELGMIKIKSRTPHAHQIGIDASELQHPQDKYGSDEHLEPVPCPVRSASLNGQAAPSEAKKVLDCFPSLQPDRSSQARHVHPKLPDYDDLAAHFAALKGQ